MAAVLCRLEGKTHPRHWRKLYKSHSPAEWAMQKAMAIVEPFGENRADQRAAINTIASGIKISEENIDEVYEYLTNYTGDEDDQEELEADPEVLASLGDH